MSLLPPADIDTRVPLITSVAAGVELYRFHSAAYDPIYFDRTLGGRLNAPDGTYGVLYAAEAPHGAFAETFLRTPGRRTIDPYLQASKAFATLEVSRQLDFLLLDGPSLAILGATAEIVHGGLPYDAPQSWSRALHGHPIGADGIAYTSRHDPSQLCYAIFERSADAIRLGRRQLDLDADWFWEIAETYAVGRAP